MIIKKFLWFTPFLCFLFGYHLINYMFPVKETVVPNLIGRPITEAAKALSECCLNLRILTEKEDNNLPEGIILNQNPASQKKIKVNKPVYVVLSKKGNQIKTPDFKGKLLHDIEQIASQMGIKLKIYYVESNQKENLCICQNPKPGDLLNQNEKIILYITLPSKKTVIMPDFKGLNLTDVENFLDLYQIKPTLLTKDSIEYNSKKIYTIIDQRPMPGSLILLDKNVNMQLYIQE